MSTPKAVVLLSDRLDSATVLAMAMNQGFDAYAMSFRYGQRHIVELDKAREVAQQLGATQHIIVDIDLRAFGGSALTSDIAVPKGRSAADMSHGIPSTYVPARNTIFLSFALAWAEVVGSGDIFVGVNALDYSGYPDCRPEYLEAFERMANLATKAGVEHTQAQNPHSAHQVEQSRHRQNGRSARRRLLDHQQLLRSGREGRTLRQLRFLPVARKGFHGGGSAGSFAGEICAGLTDVFALESCPS